MTDAVQPSESAQEESFWQEQSNYWKHFLADLFIGTIQRMTISVRERQWPIMNCLIFEFVI